MVQFILATFTLLAIAFWIMSGGSSFEPEARPEPVQVAIEEPAPQPEPTPELEFVVETPAEESTPEPAPAVVTEPAPQPEAAPEPAPEPAPAPDYRTVSASRVNMRSGPSTDYRVLSTLTQGTEVEVLEIDELGSEPWARLLVLDTGLEGWMATRFLAAQ